MMGGDNDIHQSGVELSESLAFIGVAVKLIKTAEQIMDETPTYGDILRCYPTLSLAYA